MKRRIKKRFRKTNNIKVMDRVKCLEVFLWERCTKNLMWDYLQSICDGEQIALHRRYFTSNFELILKTPINKSNFNRFFCIIIFAHCVSHVHALKRLTHINKFTFDPCLACVAISNPNTKHWEPKPSGQKPVQSQQKKC